MSSPPGLSELARSHGIETHYRGFEGEAVQASTDAMQAVLRAMRIDAETAADIERGLEASSDKQQAEIVSPVTLCQSGDTPRLLLNGVPPGSKVECKLKLEDGSEMGVTAVTEYAEPAGSSKIDLPAVPVGYHEAAIEWGARQHQTTILSAPPKAAPPAHRRGWGLFAPVYALRSDGNAGAGDLTDLRTLLELVSGLGGDFVGTLPLLASFLDEPFEPSPYSPISRVLWNEFFARVPGVDESGATAARRLPLVDYRRVAQLKRDALSKQAEEAWGNTRWNAVQDLVARRPEVDLYARFRGTMEARGTAWKTWPKKVGRRAFEDGEFDERTYRYHLWAQTLVTQQFEETAAAAKNGRTGLYLDFPVGVHPDGFDAWHHQDLFADEINVGAPPDSLFRGGQDWGFRPMLPRALRECAYQPIREALTHHMAVASMLRIDHVMGLHRLYWVPSTLGPRDGVYVRYPAEELYAVIAIESQRHGASVVGEDLGTVPAEVRPAMERNGIGRMFVVQFEMDERKPNPLPEPPENALACLNTHDMPPFQQFLEESDSLGERRTAALSLMLGEQASPLDPSIPQLTAKTYSWLSKSRAENVLVNVEDLWGETERQNAPGTTSDEEPNWQRRLRYSLEELSTLPAFRSLERMTTLREENTL